MLVDKLQENKNKDEQISQDIIAKAVIMLKKRSLPRRMRALLTILDKCDMVIEGSGSTTANSLLSYFADEMQALREAMTQVGYSGNDPKCIQEACTIYRVKKYSK